jgi:hypothetical protein
MMREEGRGKKRKKEEGRGHWCQLNAKPLVRQGLKPLSQRSSPRSRTKKTLKLK